MSHTFVWGWLVVCADRAGHRFLDSEQRIIASKVIKRFVLHAKKTAFVIEHDFIMATYLADRVIVFEGKPAVSATANPYVPRSLSREAFTHDSTFLQAAVAADGHEQVPGLSRDHVPPRPDQLPAAREQAQQYQGPRAEGYVSRSF